MVELIQILEQNLANHDAMIKALADAKISDHDKTG